MLLDPRLAGQAGTGNTADGGDRAPHSMRPGPGLSSGTLTGPLERLHLEIKSAATEPYLLTVTGNDRPHCSYAAVEWDRDRIRVPAPSGWDVSVARGHLRVTLLWPPEKPGGYSLIVDGTAVTITVNRVPCLEVTPTRAVLHRRGTPPSPNDSPCQSDCILILPD